MIVTSDMVKEWASYYLKSHPYTTTHTYYSFIHRFVGQEIELTQKAVNDFRDTQMSRPAVSGLKAFFRFLVQRKGFPGEIQKFYFNKSKPTKYFPRSIPLVEIEAIIKQLETSSSKSISIMSRLIFEAALRISEALKLQWDDFNWSEWILNKDEWGSMSLKNTKRGKFRVVPVPSSVMHLLYDNHEAKNEAGIPIGGRVFTYYPLPNVSEIKGPDKEELIAKAQYEYIANAGFMYRDELEKAAKMAINKRITPHQFRHSKAQILLNMGFPIDSLKELLGHASLSSTQIYAQASPEKVKRDLKNVYSHANGLQNS